MIFALELTRVVTTNRLKQAPESRDNASQPYRVQCSLCAVGARHRKRRHLLRSPSRMSLPHRHFILCDQSLKSIGGGLLAAVLLLCHNLWEGFLLH